MAGHKDIQTTYETYMHLADKTLQKAAMRHPAVRMNVPPHEIMQTIKEAFANFHLENDPRFTYSIAEEGNSLKFELFVK